MKIPYSWLKEFIDTRLSPAQAQEALTMAGVEVSSCRFLGEGLDSVVTARILEMRPHPDADRLSLCKVTDGSTTFGIVCGAKNMKAGDAVALAKIGARLPNGVEIKKAKIRGQASEGMLCSEQELKLAEASAGIMILPEDTAPGKPLADALGLSDWLLEVEITPNRGDCLSVLGVAREIASITGEKVVLPDVSFPEEGEPIGDLVRIDVSDPDLCPRYTARAISGVTIAPSPDWMRRRLTLCGIRPINNIVDVTNYLLLEVGQPMHAFDLDRLRGARIDVRAPKETLTFTTLDGSERKIDPGMLLIRDGEGPVAVAGVMGGANSEVVDGTTRVVFESAHFSPPSIRRTAKRLGLSSEASYRFERGVDPAGTVYAADRAVSLLSRFAPLSVAKGVIDVGGENVKPRTVPFRPERATRIMGRVYAPEACLEIFARLGFPVADDGTGTWNVTVPTHRFDIEREIDLVEEVARLSGYDSIPTTYPESKAPEFSGDDRFVDIQERAFDFLRGRGFSQAVNFSFVAGRTWERLGAFLGFDPADAVRLVNPISDDDDLDAPPPADRAPVERGGQRTPFHRRRPALRGGKGVREVVRRGALRGGPARRDPLREAASGRLVRRGRSRGLLRHERGRGTAAAAPLRIPGPRRPHAPPAVFRGREGGGHPAGRRGRRLVRGDPQGVARGIRPHGTRLLRGDPPGEGDRFAAAAGSIRAAAEVSSCFQGRGVRLPDRGAGGRRSRDGSRGFPRGRGGRRFRHLHRGKDRGREQERRDPGETAIP